MLTKVCRFSPKVKNAITKKFPNSVFMGFWKACQDFMKKSGFRKIWLLTAFGNTVVTALAAF